MKRKFVWLVVSCLVAALLVTSCGGAKEEVVVTPEEKAVKEIPLPPMPVEIGQRVANELLAVTLTEAKIDDSYEYYSPIEEKNVTAKAKPGELFLLGYFIFENMYTKQHWTGLRYVRLYDAEGNYWLAAQDYLGEERLLSSHFLQPGETIKGWVLVRFPEEAPEPLTLKYLASQLSYEETPEKVIEWEFTVSEYKAAN